MTTGGHLDHSLEAALAEAPVVATGGGWGKHPDLLPMQPLEVLRSLDHLAANCAVDPLIDRERDIVLVKLSWLEDLFAQWVAGDAPLCEDVCLVDCKGPCQGVTDGTSS